MLSARRGAGAVGPTAFVAAWVIAGARRRGYSPVDDAISELARIGESSRPLMTLGFVTFGAAVPAYAISSRRDLGTPATVALTVAGLATLAVAALPLRDGSSGAPHGIAAVIGYAGMAAAPYLATRSRSGLVLSAASAIALAATLLDAGHGLSQRVGLGIVDAWIVWTALRRPRA